MKHTHLKPYAIPVVAALLASAAFSSPAFAVNYSITEIAGPYDIKNNGDMVTGSSTIRHADGTTTDLSALDLTNIHINDNGVVAGSRGSYQFHTVMLTRYASIYDHGMMTDVTTYAAAPSTAGIINNNNSMLGASGFMGSGGYQFLYSNGVITNLTAQIGRQMNFADMNDGEQIVANDMSSTGKAYLYDNGVLTELTLQGRGQNTVSAINNSGQIVGEMGTASSKVMSGTAKHAFLYQDGATTDLGTLPFNTDSKAFDINNLGAAVGYAYNQDSFPSAPWDYFVATLFQDGQVIDLNTRISATTGWRLTQAFHINDLGQITGAGFLNGDGKTHYFMLTPNEVPVPAAAWLFGSSLLGLAGLQKRRRS